MRRKLIIGIVGLMIGIFFDCQDVSAASLSLSPAAGTFVVGSTFDISLLLNTEEEAVNAVSVFLQFPSDKLQLISPTSGKSAIDLWVVPPRFNNVAGTIELQGVITGGTRASNVLITSLTFRARSVGVSVIKIGDESRVLLHDGAGTDALRTIGNGIYTLVLPPPAGPVVVSETHPDESRWYRNTEAMFTWQPATGLGVGGYSYTFNDIPVEIPDTITEGTAVTASYHILSDGTFYFHIRESRNGSWGGTTHFSIHNDITIPAEFPITVNPSPRTTDRQPVVRFETTDAASGIEHYELKLLSRLGTEPSFDQSLFIEAQSPFILPELKPGDYEVLVRAFDKAGNHREIAQTIVVREPLFGVVFGEEIGSDGFWIKYGRWLLIALVIIMLFVGYEVGHWRRKKHTSPNEVT